ncbi:MAG: hypothetical protein C5B59_13775, partial [Bacteroidetes bacterium]
MHQWKKTSYALLFFFFLSIPGIRSQSSLNQAGIGALSPIGKSSSIYSSYSWIQFYAGLSSNLTAPTISCPGNQTVCATIANNYTNSGAGWDATAMPDPLCPTITSLTFATDAGVNPSSGSTLAGAIFSVGTHTITWTATDNCGNTSTCNYTITINPLPNVTAPSSVCVGSTATLSPTSGGTWTSSDNTIATVSNAGVITGVSPGTVTFTFIDGSTNCSNTTSAVTVNALPVVAAPVSVCVGGTATLSPAGGGTWTSSNNAIATVTNAGVVNGISVGTVTFSFTDAATNCSTTTSSVTINSTPAITSGANGTICSGVAQNYTIASDVAGTTFSWSRAAVAGISNAAVVSQTDNPITETLTNTTSGAVTVTYVITPSANGCAGTPFNYVVTVNPSPTVSSAATGTICSGVAQNYAIASNVAGTTFSWSRAAVAGISNAAVVGQTDNPITETLTNTTTAAINVTYVITPSANGCIGTPFNYVVTVN